MENFLRRRVKERLNVLDLNPFEAARRIGAERTFVNDLLTGKKETMRPAAVVKLAEVLDCDPEYLIGAQSTPRKPVDVQSGTMVLAGTCEAGVWRSAEAEAPTALPVSPDPRYPPERQAAYLIRGHHADGLGLMDGDVLVALDEEAVRSGDIIISRRRREGGDVELTVRLVEGDELRARSGEALKPPQKVGEAEILGRVILAHRIFGGR